MCTAKIPPRPCLFLLAALFLLAGCSPQYSMRVISETDGHAYPNDQYTYYIASSKKQNSDPTYQLLKQDVKNTLSETGFTLTQDRNRGTALLSIDYTAKTSTKHITVKKPIYGQTGTVEKTHGTYDKATGRYTKTTTTTPTYGTVGYEDEIKEVTECDIFLHLSAASSKTNKELWSTSIYHTHDSEDISGVLSVMIRGCRIISPATQAASFHCRSRQTTTARSGLWKSNRRIRPAEYRRQEKGHQHDKRR